jgi:transaldolase/glucose-6-phosphate isomerase
MKEGDLTLFGGDGNVAASERDGTLADHLRAHLDQIRDGDYCALLAYIERNKLHRDALQKIRSLIRDRKRVATCLEFGPRFLHSTGQAYKGGPNTGVFLQITCDDSNDIQVPGQQYTFGVVKAAQARADLDVLAQRGRRALRVHLGPHVAAGLAQLEEAISKAFHMN